MKRIFTISLMLLSISSYGQRYEIDKKKILHTSDNYELMIYYPVFTSGVSMEMLNKFVANSFVKQNPVKTFGVDVVSSAGIENMYLKSAEILKNEGLKKSIEPITLKVLSNWHFYDNQKITSLIIDQYIIVGRENLLTSTSVINIDPASGKTFNVKDYIVDSVDLLNDVADQFCKDKGLPRNATRLLTGLRCDLANLPLAKEIGFSDVGVVFFYNRGEIANIGFPPIKVEVPYKKVFDNFAPAMLNDSHSVIDGEKPTMTRLKKLVKESRKIKNSPKR